MRRTHPMAIKAHIAEGMKPLVDLVYPPRCPLCGDAISSQSGLCPECWSELEFPGEPACASCSRPMASSSPGAFTECFVCKSDPPRHDGVIAATLYNDISRRLILTYKHGGKITLAKLLGQLMAARMPAADTGNPPLLIPVPLHRWRLWKRGFNQAALLARELSRLGHGELMVDGLVRARRTPSLGGLGREERAGVLAGAIIARTGRTKTINGRSVVLVDDVLTSGATSDACVSALLDAGAASVKIACFARVVDGSGMGAGRRKSETPEAITAPGAA